MADDDAIRGHRIECSCRIDQSLAFRYAAGYRGDVDDVCREALAGDFKRRAGASRSFEKQVDDGFSTQGWNFLDRTGRNLLKRFSRVENPENLIARKILDTQQVLHSGFSIT